jgi:acetylglutamate kinase
LSKKIESVTAKDKLAEILTAKKLITVSDKQKVFIEKRFKGIEDLSDEGFKKYIESEINEYKAMVEILGAPTDEIVSNDDTTSATDATKAKNNPLLEEDFNANI